MAKKRRYISHFRKTIYTILIAFAIISFWRGVWGLMDLYLIPESHAISFLISIFIGILILSQTKNLLNHLV